MAGLQGIAKPALSCFGAALLAVSAAAAQTPSPDAALDAVESAHEHPAQKATIDVNYINVFENWRARVRDEGFHPVEESLLARAAGARDDAEAVADLAYFYFAMELMPEAIAAIEKHSEQDPAIILLKGAAAVKMGRWRDAVAILSSPLVNDIADAAPWRGLAYARLGAFEKAAQDLFRADFANAPFEEQAVEFYLVQAQTALSSDDIDDAVAALNALRNLAETTTQREMRRMLEARLVLASGDRKQAENLLDDLVRNAAAPVLIHAKIELLRIRQAAGALTKSEALNQLTDISLEWSGGAVERERLALESAWRDQAGDIIGAAQTRRALLIYHPQSDAAKAAQAALRAALPTILTDRTLSPRAAANIFYQNIDLAPPGAAGDALIRDAVDALAGLDLLPEAAELLRHQAFERLRGVERARAGADLAEIYLALDDPAAAIDALENTQRTRLPDEVAARRNYVEAAANFSRGDADQALKLVADRSDVRSMVLRGRILSANGDYQAAGAAFAAAATSGDGALLSDQVDAAILAGSAYLKCGADEDLSVLSEKLDGRIPGGPAQDLFKAIVDENLPESPSVFTETYAAYFSG